MPLGVIQSINEDKGFAFIKPNEGGDDVFFHKSAFDGMFIKLRRGALMRYELDTAAEKPRASQVVPADRRPAGTVQFGHVVRKSWKSKIGVISPVKGGTEVIFEPEALIGTRFDRLELSEYVEFVLDPDPIDPKQPEACFVILAEKARIASVPQLARHPNSRAKKPNWRNK